MSIADEVEQDLEQFDAFVRKVLQKTPKPQTTLEQLMLDFRNYQAALQKLREEIRPAYEASLRGEGERWDIENVKNMLIDRLKDKGIA